MPIKTGPYLNTKDIYIDYSFEEVLFRRMKSDGSIYKKFYGEEESKRPSSSDDKLYCDALLYGNEITKDDYEKGA